MSTGNNKGRGGRGNGNGGRGNGGGRTKKKTVELGDFMSGMTAKYGEEASQRGQDEQDDDEVSLHSFMSGTLEHQSKARRGRSPNPKTTTKTALATASSRSASPPTLARAHTGEFPRNKASSPPALARAQTTSNAPKQTARRARLSPSKRTTTATEASVPPPLLQSTTSSYSSAPSQMGEEEDPMENTRTGMVGLESTSTLAGGIDTSGGKPRQGTNTIDEADEEASESPSEAQDAFDLELRPTLSSLRTLSSDVNKSSATGPAQSPGSLERQGSASSKLFDNAIRNTMYQVDQSVNLMDKNAAAYEKRPSSRRRSILDLISGGSLGGSGDRDSLTRSGSARNRRNRRQTKRGSVMEMMFGDGQNQVVRKQSMKDISLGAGRRHSRSPVRMTSQKEVKEEDDDGGESSWLWPCFTSICTFLLVLGIIMFFVLLPMWPWESVEFPPTTNAVAPSPVPNIPWLQALGITSSNSNGAQKQQRKQNEPTPLDQMTARPSVVPTLAASLSPLMAALAGAPTPVEPAEVTERRNELRAFLLDLKVTSLEDLISNPTSPAAKATEWLTNYDPGSLNVKDPIMVERYAVATLFFSTHPDYGVNFTQGASGTSTKTATRLRHRDLEETLDESALFSDGWMSKSSVCDWKGIACNPNRTAIVVFNVSHSGLTGTLTSELALLTDLVELDLSNNFFHGTVPEILGKRLTHLAYFLVDDNALTGALPASVGSMERAYHLDLSSNNLQGTLPSEIGNLVNVRLLLLDQNKFSGALPSSLEKLTNIEFLYLNNNEFTSQIPDATFSKLGSLLDLRLQDNHLVGSIPSEVRALHRLEILNMAKNKLTKYIPDVFDRLQNLIHVDLSENKLSGTLPKTIGRLSKLKYLDLKNNELMSGIPSDWFEKLTNLRSLVLDHNSLNSSIPIGIGGMEQLQELWLNHNQLTSSIPSEMGLLHHLVDLYLEHNALTGEPPVSLGMLHQLKTLHLFDNKLKGSIDSAICLLKFECMLSYISADCIGRELSCECCDKCY